MFFIYSKNSKIITLFDDFGRIQEKTIINLSDPNFYFSGIANADSQYITSPQDLKSFLSNHTVDELRCAEGSFFCHLH
jgi:hypothetical protein